MWRRWISEQVTYLFAHCVTLYRNARDGDSAASQLPSRCVEAAGLIVKGPATTAEKVAEYLVWHGQKHGDPLTNLKLQKLLYYAHGWYVALYDRDLFSAPMKAWVRGPVVPGVWKRFNRYGWQPINERISEPEVSEHVKAHLNEVLRAYGDYSAFTLEDMTHSESPWLKARKDTPRDMASSVSIDPNDIREHFSHLAAKTKAKGQSSTRHSQT